jgi:NAD+ diphosphatase
MSARSEASAFTGYASNLSDRAAHVRDSEGAIRQMRASRHARFAVLAGEKPILRRVGERFDIWWEPEHLGTFGASEQEAFLGREGEAGLFGVRIAPARADELKGRPDLLPLDLRSIAVQGLVAPEALGALGYAKQMTDWHARHRFCANCGQPTAPAQGGWRRDCAACGAQHFPRTDPVAIMLVTSGDDCLLARQARFPPGVHSCIAGFVEAGETIEDAVRRETFEETGLLIGRVSYLASQPWPFPSSLMIGCQAEADTRDIVLDRAELEAGRWFSRAEVRAILAGTHPDGITCPPPIAIAHTLMRLWADAA